MKPRKLEQLRRISARIPYAVPLYLQGTRTHDVPTLRLLLQALRLLKVLDFGVSRSRVSGV